MGAIQGAVLELQDLQRRALRGELPQRLVVQHCARQMQVLEVAGDEGHVVEVGEVVVPWVMAELDEASPAVYGGADPHFDVLRGVVLPVVVVLGTVGHVWSILAWGAGQDPEGVQRRGRLPQEQEVVGEAGEPRGEAPVPGLAADPEVDAGRGSPEVTPAAREHAGAGHLPRPQERHDLVEEVVREGAEAVEAGGSVEGDGLGSGFLPPGHFVERLACFRWLLRVCWDWE